MVKKTEIQVFVSSPNDVAKEKNIVEAICKDLTESIENYCKISFRVKEWSSIVGQFGVNTQQQITNKIGNYDIYLGIWWMRFGSKTGNINNHTGEEFESGTHEEFVQAYDKYTENKFPSIYLFFKKFRAPKNTETAQLNKVSEFQVKQKDNGWVHNFRDKVEFQRKIQNLLNEKMLDLCFKSNIQQKENIYAVTPSFKKEEYKKNFKPLIGYIDRKLIHFTKETNLKNFFGESIPENLIDLIKTKQHIVILGDAGSGKSTELKNLAFNLESDISQYVPRFIKLNTYTPKSGFENFLPPEWSKIPHNLLVLIIDGLDEIQPQDFNTVVRQINTFSEKYPDLRIVISCRTNFYELPINNEKGTLTGFEPYFIKDLSLKDAKNYFEEKYLSQQGDSFIAKIYNESLLELIQKPYFLMLLSEIYSQNKNLSSNRAALNEAFILSRLTHDEIHYKGTIDIKSKTVEILHLLEKVALGMEILGKNTISQLDLLEIVSSDELLLLRYCTVFNKVEGGNIVWQFEHNNIQEFLAAKALSSLDFEKSIQFLTFEPANTKLIPSWVNTLSFLFSIIDKQSYYFKKLFKWLLINEKEIIVKFEKDKVDEEFKNTILKGIFNHYKGYDVWLSSNKFSYKELANFSQTDSNIYFLLNELKEPKNSRIIKTNAINILGYFNYEALVLKKEVEDLLINLIDESDGDVQFISTIIYSLRNAKLNAEEVISKLMCKIGSRNNEYIRSAMYSILVESGLVDNYVDYIIDGLSIDKKNDEDRGKVTLGNESWAMTSAIKSIKTAPGLEKLINFLASRDYFDLGYNKTEIIKEIIENCKSASQSNNSLYTSMKKWLLKEMSHFSDSITDMILPFFDATNTRGRLFNELWEKKGDLATNDNFKFAKVVSTPEIEFIIQQYNDREITNNDLKSIHWSMNWQHNPNLDIFEKLINEKTSFKIEKPLVIDYQSIQKKRLKDDFDILFNIENLKSEVNRIFDQEEKEEFSFDELFDVRRENNKDIELEDKYIGSALGLLRDFINSGETIKKETVNSWFEKHEIVEWYLIGRIYDIIRNNTDLEISTDQVEFILNWCEKNIKNGKFSNAIEEKENGERSIRFNAIYLFYFSTHFDFTYENEILLEMLLFDYFEGSNWIGINYIIKKVPFQEIKDRIILNLKNGIQNDQVTKNHIVFALNNKLLETYPIILKEILNINRNEYTRQEILKLYSDSTKNFKSLIDIIDEADEKIKWEIIDSVIYADIKSENLTNYLVGILEEKISDEYKIKASERLIRMQDIRGLEFYANYISDTIDPKVYKDEHTHILHTLNIIDAVPLLMELLEISYKRNIQLSHYENLNSVVIGALFNIALIKEENLLIVKSKLFKFIKNNRDKYSDIRFLILTYERMDSQYYMNKIQEFTIKQVKEKLSLLKI